MGNSNGFLIENGILIKYTGTDTDVVIPSELDGVAVTGNYCHYVDGVPTKW